MCIYSLLVVELVFSVSHGTTINWVITLTYIRISGADTSSQTSDIRSLYQCVVDLESGEGLGGSFHTSLTALV